MIGYSGRLKADQLWLLEEERSQPGFYYITNAVHQNYRITKKYASVICEVKSPKSECQLWKFVNVGTDIYRIFNLGDSQSKITMWRYGHVAMYTGPDYSDQIWKFKPLGTGC